VSPLDGHGHGHGATHPCDLGNGAGRLQKRPGIEKTGETDVDASWDGVCERVRPSGGNADGGTPGRNQHVWRLSWHESCAMQAMQRCREGGIPRIHAQEHRECVQGGRHLLDGD